MDEIDEPSKAVAEAAKFGIASVGAIEKFGSFLSKIIDEPITDVVGYFGDRLKFVRWKNKLMIMDKVNQILDERCIVNTRPIHPKIAIPIMEYATLEDDESLQNIWCKLIANSIDPSFDIEIRYAFIEIVRNLTSLDAKILKYIYGMVKEDAEKQLILLDCQVSYVKIAETIHASNMDIDISLYNLKRVQCIWDTNLYETVKSLASIIARKEEIHKVEESFTLTPLGYYFIKACIV